MQDQSIVFIFLISIAVIGGYLVTIINRILNELQQLKQDGINIVSEIKGEYTLPDESIQTIVKLVLRELRKQQAAENNGKPENPAGA